MGNKFLILTTLLLLLSGCGKDILGSSFVNDIRTVTPSPSIAPALPAANLTLSTTSLRVGSLLTISSTSTDLSNATSATVNGTSAIILNKSTNQMQVFVMPGSTSGYVGVATTTGVDYAASQVIITQAAAGASYTQLGDKLVGSDVSGTTNFATSVDISSDGDTAAVGGPVANTGEGGAWVYARNGASWTQQSLKLVGSNVSGTSLQGFSTALSADGNTMMSGGATDNNNLGAIWFFTRSGTSWTQQGPKIVPTDASGTMTYFGISGDLSADGNTAIIGGIYDDNMMGATWIYVRQGTSWTQQAKLLASDTIGNAAQGYKVALSADGNTAIVGAPYDDSTMGAAWVYTRSGSSWTQQGKLVGTNHLGVGNVGFSVALSADGNTAAVGGPYDDGTAGAVWIFTRSGVTWSEEAKLVATGNLGVANIGYSVALTADGNTAVLGGPNDNTLIGASWIFTRSGTTWTERSKKQGSGGVGNSVMSLSTSISADGSVMMCGGSWDNSNTGAVWVFGK